MLTSNCCIYLSTFHWTITTTHSYPQKFFFLIPISSFPGTWKKVYNHEEDLHNSMYRKKSSSAAENTGSRKINSKKLRCLSTKKKVLSSRKKLFWNWRMNNERENSMADGWAFSFSLSSSSFASLLFFVQIFLYVQHRALDVYKKYFFFCFPLHTQYHFNAVVASYMQPKYRWIFFYYVANTNTMHREATPFGNLALVTIVIG